MSKRTGMIVLGAIAAVGVTYFIIKLLSQKPGVAAQPPAPLPDVAAGTSEVLQRDLWWPATVLDL